MIICAGEILADMIGKEENGTFSYERYAGGAPFNVACGLKKLGVPCGFCGCVGDDTIGDFLAGFAERQKFDYCRIRRDPSRNTTLAFVELSDSGERKFRFYRKHTADYCLPRGAAEEIAGRADIVHIGSLPLSKREGRVFVDELIAAAHARGKKVSFDVNYRTDVFAGAAKAAEVIAKYIALADIVKLSEEELPLFTSGETMENRLCLLAGTSKIVFLTLGAQGSMACVKGTICKEPSIKIRAVDTTGAGDAFFAGVLSLLNEGETDMARVLRRGNICGALTTAQKGAYPLWDKAAAESVETTGRMEQ